MNKNPNASVDRGATIARGIIALALAIQCVALVRFLRETFPSGALLPAEITIAALILVPFALIGIWKRKTWGEGIAIFLFAWNATVDLWAWSVQHYHLAFLWLAINAAAYVLLLWQ